METDRYNILLVEDNPADAAFFRDHWSRRCINNG